MRSGRSKRTDKAKRKAFEQASDAFLARKNALDAGDKIEAERQAKIEEKSKAKFEAAKRRFNRQQDRKFRAENAEIHGEGT